MKRKSRVISFIIGMIPFFVYFCLYPQMPSKIAIHYNINSMPDRYVLKSSWEVFLLCGVSIIMLLFMEATTFVIVKVSELSVVDNKKNVRRIMEITNTILSVTFSCVVIYFLFASTGLYKLNLIDLLRISDIFIGVLFIAYGNYLPKFKQNRFAGFRIKETLENEEVWFKTQRFSGRVCILGGLAIILTSIIPGIISIVICYVIIFLSTILPIFYAKRI